LANSESIGEASTWPLIESSPLGRSHLGEITPEGATGTMVALDAQQAHRH
jgi:hypothetical protein